MVMKRQAISEVMGRRGKLYAPPDRALSLSFATNLRQKSSAPNRSVFIPRRNLAAAGGRGNEYLQTGTVIQWARLMPVYLMTDISSPA